MRFSIYKYACNPKQGQVQYYKITMKEYGGDTAVRVFDELELLKIQAEIDKALRP
jgi:hypothetical protein